MELRMTGRTGRATAREQLRAVRGRVLRHDVRNALHVVQLNASLLAEDCDGVDAERAAELCSTAARLEATCADAREADEPDWPAAGEEPRQSDASEESGQSGAEATNQSALVVHLRTDLERMRASLHILLAELDDEADATCARWALAAVEDLLGTLEKLTAARRHLQTERSPVVVDLSEVVRRVVATRESTFADVTVAVDCPEVCRVRTVPAMELVVENLLENAAAHTDAADGADPQVQVTVEPDPDAVTLTIRDDGPGIPAQVFAALAAGAETSLEHCDGVGLWLVHWVVTGTDATAEFHSDADGTAVTLRVPR